MAATLRQLKLIDDLIAERPNIDPQVKANIYEIARRPDADPRRDGPVSRVIGQLMRMPKGGGSAGPAARAPRGDALLRSLGIEKAKYAIPASEVPGAAREALGDNDHLFVEVREYEGTRYMRQLHGAPGSFSRTRLPAHVVSAVAHVLEGHCQEFSQLFGRLYTCCGVCGAELTDARSRELALGPECRGRFGLR